MNRAKAEAKGDGPAERKAHHARQRELVIQAEAELQKKQDDHANELRVREHLQRQIALLESVTKDGSLADQMHRMVLRALTQAAAAAAAGTDPAAQETTPAADKVKEQQGAETVLSEVNGAVAAIQAAHASPSLVPPTRHPLPVELEDLPLSLETFDDKVLQRTAEMTLENTVALYKSFISKAQFAVSHVRCHGEHSYMNQELAETVARFGNLVMVHSFLQLPLQRRCFRLNFLTMEEEEAPEGWYARIAKAIPVHTEFASLVQAGILCAQKVVGRECDASVDSLKQVRQLMLDKDSSDQAASGDFVHLDHVDSLLDRCERCTNSVLLLRSMLGVYIFGGMLRLFDSAVIGQAMVSCWPYALRVMAIFEEYAKRPDVQAVLRQEKPGQGRRQRGSNA